MRFEFSFCRYTWCASNKGKLDARVSQSDIASLYDKISDIYDIWGKMTESRARNRAIELAEIKDGNNILEVAAGTGLAFYKIFKINQNGNKTGFYLSNGLL
jgi:ubiquinone/menaquinone biosynthesis C-methylase UbiE